MRARNLARVIVELKRGVRIVGTTDQAKVSPTTQVFGFSGSSNGSRGSGIRRLTADLCDQLIHIPMSGSVECLNETVATVCYLRPKDSDHFIGFKKVSELAVVGAVGACKGILPK